MFDVIHWMLQCRLAPPLIPHGPWVYLYHGCHSVFRCQITAADNKEATKDRKRGASL